MIINNFPFPVSTNQMYETHIKYKTTRTGKRVPQTYRRRSVELEKFYEKCYIFKNLNKGAFDVIAHQVKAWLDSGQMIGMDCYIAFEKSRLFTQKGDVKQIDSDNLRKSLQDGFCKLLNIDDKYVFCGNTEKISCERKESECAIIKLYPITPKCLESLNL